MNLKNLVVGSAVCGVVGLTSASATNNLSRADISVLTATVEYSYVGAGHAKFAGTKYAESDAHAGGVSLTGRIPVGHGWFIPVSVGYQHLALGNVTGAPVPPDADLLRIGVGLGRRCNSNLTVFASAGPVFYNLGEVTGDNLGVGGLVLASYVLNPQLRLVAGLVVVPDSEFPVFPMIGVSWQIRENLTLDVGVPRTRLTYRFAGQASVYTGIGFQSATFRTADTLAAKTGVTGFNHALATYHDVRVGAGFGYDFCGPVAGEVEAGWSVFRRLDYPRLDEYVDFEAGPYVQCGLRLRF